MKLIYEEKDISEFIEISKVDFTDNAGFIADSIELCFSDTKNIWSTWKPQKNHKLRILHEGFDSGIMYVDELEQRKGTFIIRALSIPQEAKNYNSQGWEAIRFLELATQIASRYKFNLKTYGVENYYYQRVDQLEQSDIEFLAQRCILEGCILKICNNSIVIYNEAYIEGAEAVRTILFPELEGIYKFLNKATNIFNSCEIKNNGIKSTFKPATAPMGADLKLSDIYLTSQGEADRFAKNILRSKNKYEWSGTFVINLDTTIAAASNVDIKGIGISDGKYFCEQVIHSFIEQKTIIKCRKPLEGY